MCKELLILGVIVSFLRIFTKAVYTQDVYGLQKSANLYFAVSIVIMFICMVFYNLAHKLPIMKYYDEVKIQAVAAEEDNGPLTGFVWRSAVWDTVGTIKCIPSRECKNRYRQLHSKTVVFPSILRILARSEIFPDRDSCDNTDLYFRAYKWIPDECAGDFGT
ncbi:hypothetical protein TSUD_227600 [Trifolium subterraneum]|uniref:Uncharacterized protein n=1 Tax=Trifolium subterraneum TaxID=3900 RepID=A0A2Z6LSD3_TRISU|nr:hypothetical protein TSUD_227600 [Trifolium subterraneum]